LDAKVEEVYDHSRITFGHHINHLLFPMSQLPRRNRDLRHQTLEQLPETIIRGRTQRFLHALHANHPTRTTSNLIGEPSYPTRTWELFYWVRLESADFGGTNARRGSGAESLNPTLSRCGNTPLDGVRWQSADLNKYKRVLSSRLNDFRA
jgi:hypothetical protein